MSRVWAGAQAYLGPRSNQRSPGVRGDCTPTGLERLPLKPDHFIYLGCVYESPRMLAVLALVIVSFELIVATPQLFFLLKTVVA